MELPKSRYLDFFLNNPDAFSEAAENAYGEVIADVILVERIKMPEQKTASGIIIAEARNQIGTLNEKRPTFYRVLVPGKGYYDDTTKESVPLNAKPGDIVLLSVEGTRVFSSFPGLESYEADTLCITRESEITWRFFGEDKFREFVRNLNQATKTQMVPGSR
jgi:co-chaperonin GroES (HSP10)